jgi:hypothetical protein
VPHVRILCSDLRCVHHFDVHDRLVDKVAKYLVNMHGILAFEPGSQGGCGIVRKPVREMYSVKEGTLANESVDLCLKR